MSDDLRCDCGTLGYFDEDDFFVCPACEDAEEFPEQDFGAADWDSYVLESAGWGTNEDYGYYGE